MKLILSNYCMTSLNSAPAIETHLETQTVLYPTLQQLVRFLPWDRKRVVDYVREEAKHNPFLIEINDASPLGRDEALLEDVLPDWYSPPAQELSLSEHLLGQISVSIPSRQREALIYLTQWLSNSGYLEETPSYWATGSVWSAAQLEAVVPILQSLDPPGIGARSLQECLLLQLKDQPQSLAFLLVQEYLEELANCTGNSLEARHNRELLLQKLRQRKQIAIDADIEAIANAIHEIQQLEPRPARNFGSSDAPIVTPDLKAELTASYWQVSLAYEVEKRFCLNSDAIELLQKSPKQARDTQQLQALLQKAKNLLTALHLWQENLLKVGQFLVERQQAFLQSRDKLDLVPTPQQLVAQSVGLSNSTISRIVRGRYILICDQHSRIIPLYSLCVPVRVGGRTPAQIQQLLAQLIEEESPAHPYSDEQLAQLLRIRFGLAITRRTVTKYRKIAGINSSHHRHIMSG